MRKSVVFASFITIAASGVGASALSNISFKGADTLYEVTNDIIANCPAITNTGFQYLGLGSASGESALNTGAQTIAPMSRFIKGRGPVVCDDSGCSSATGAGCVSNANGSPTTTEGLVIGMDGITFVGSALTAGSEECNGSIADCDQATEAHRGLAYSKTIYLSASTYTLNGWRDVLRIVYGGVNAAAGSTIANRDCNSELRQTIINNWGNLFESGCTSAACTYLRHAFRPDDSSGTTETLVSVLGLAPIVLASRISPFCNARLTTAPAPTIGRYQPDYADEDPIRRACAGSGTATSTAATEQVCSRLGNLGVVLPISPIDYLAPSAAYPTTPCAAGAAKFGNAPRNYPSGSGLCPNGDTVVFGNQCLVPVDAAGNAGCLAAKINKPTFIFNNAAVDGVTPSSANMDGRVYNLHLYKPDGTYQTDKRSPPRPIQGAFHRIHITKTMNTPNNVGVCAEFDVTSQIACLVQASPCSIGFTARSASFYPGVSALKVNALEPTTACVQSQVYPLSRKLYLNTLKGFSSTTGDELELAKCFANNTKVSAALAATGLVSLPWWVPGGSVYCEDFNEQQQCDAASNVDACAANASVGLPTASTICGNGIIEALEECDDGTANGLIDSGSACSTTCRRN